MLGTGDIDEGAAERFEAIIRQHPEVRTIMLKSDGGSVVSALALGRAIRQGGIRSSRIRASSPPGTTTPALTTAPDTSQKYGPLKVELEQVPPLIWGCAQSAVAIQKITMQLAAKRAKDMLRYSEIPY